MCFVPQSDIDKILNVINNYVVANGVEGLKDYLADMKDQNKISYCGCEGFFLTREIENRILVFMEIFNKVYKFETGENPSVSITSHSEVLGDSYDDFL
jgi:hypothetical protein